MQIIDLVPVANRQGKRFLNASYLGSVLLLFVLLTPQSGIAGTVTVQLLGPTRFERTTGEPQNVTVTFPGRSGTALLQIENGSDQATRVTSASVSVNGKTIFGTSVFNKKVESLETVIAVGELNALSVEVRGGLGTYVTITVLQDIEAEAAAVVGPEGATISVTDANSPISGVALSIPAGALSQKIVLSIQPDLSFVIPYNSNIEEAYSSPAFSISPDLGPLAILAELRIPYKDSDGDGILDGTTFPIESGSVFFAFKGSLNAYRAEGIIDTALQNVVVQTDHFSSWSLRYHRWKPGTVRYFVESLPLGDVQAQKQQIQDAFSQWSAAINGVVTFTEETTSQNADIVIRERLFNKSTPSAQVTHFLGISFLSPVALELNANAANVWYTGPYPPYPFLDPPNGLPFLRIFMHEVGHVMGLGEYPAICNNYPSADPAIMAYECGTVPLPFTQLGSFDKAEIQRHYGIPATGTITLTFQVQVTKKSDFISADLVNPACTGGWVCVVNNISPPPFLMTVTFDSSVASGSATTVTFGRPTFSGSPYTTSLQTINPGGTTDTGFVSATQTGATTHAFVVVAGQQKLGDPEFYYNLRLDGPNYPGNINAFPSATVARDLFKLAIGQQFRFEQGASYRFGFNFVPGSTNYDGVATLVSVN